MLAQGRGVEADEVGEILVQQGTISRSQLVMVMSIMEPARKSGEALLDAGIVSEDEFEAALDLLLADIVVGLGYADEKEIFGCFFGYTEKISTSKAPN